jgi:hypothetical protein
MAVLHEHFCSNSCVYIYLKNDTNTIALAAWSKRLTSPPSTKKIGDTSREIESRQGIGWYLKKYYSMLSFFQTKKKFKTFEQKLTLPPPPTNSNEGCSATGKMEIFHLSVNKGLL